MIEPAPALAPPAWVHKRDGRLVPFEADKISRALFAATESLGRPDAFLARELTDGVVHFLAADADGSTPTTTLIADLVIKVVRELGQPGLAQAFTDHARQRTRSVERTANKPEVVLHFSPQDSPTAVVKACLRSHTLQTIFTRDLVAAHTDGLLALTGLESPFALAGCVLCPMAPGCAGLVEAVEAMRPVVGGLLAVDGPEYALAQAGAGDAAVATYVRELGIGLRAAGLRGVVNLNVATPPPWADDLAEGPLFAGQRRMAADEQLAALADALRDQLLGTRPERNGIRIDWHLGERDFLAGSTGRLLHLARPALEGAALAFVFDRPRRPVALGEGLDRQHPAALLTVGLHLPRLLRQLEQPRGDPAVFVQKLGSLARLALSAAVQKRDFLRRHVTEPSALTRGFLLDRARLVVAPVGLEAVAQALLGRGLCGGGAPLDFARQLVQRLRDVLRQDGRGCLLDTGLDAPADFRLDEERTTDKAGLTPWDAAATVKQQLRAAGALQAVAEAGTAAVLVPDERPPTAEQVVEWLRWAWQQTDVIRLRFVRFGAPREQLTLKLEAGA